ncbi:MAG: hypothetical protein WBQ18_14815, partial [Solirubrobacteraceae bacterium]
MPPQVADVTSSLGSLLATVGLPAPPTLTGVADVPGLAGFLRGVPTFPLSISPSDLGPLLPALPHVDAGAWSLRGAATRRPGLRSGRHPWGRSTGAPAVARSIGAALDGPAFGLPSRFAPPALP